MKENHQHIIEKIQEIFSRMEFHQKVVVFILLTVTFIFILWLINWSLK
jgi:flagellar biosynthesis/type III secretory pathway M-ring protein FliF/YscJ